MKFTLGKREQILLLLLVLVAVWVLTVKFLLMPSYDTLLANRKSLSDLQTKQTEMQTLIAQNKDISKAIEQRKQDAQASSKNFFPPFENEQMSLWLYNYTEQAKLRNIAVILGPQNTIQISPYSAAPPNLRIALSDLVDRINNKPLPVGSSDTAAAETPQEDTTKFVFTNTVTLTADCYYENLLYFIDLMYNSGRTVSISGVTFAPRNDASGNKKVITATITMEVYSIPKFYTDEFWDVTFDTPKGKSNPL